MGEDHNCPPGQPCCFGPGFASGWDAGQKAAREEEQRLLVGNFLPEVDGIPATGPVFEAWQYFNALLRNKAASQRIDAAWVFAEDFWREGERAKYGRLLAAARAAVVDWDERRDLRVGTVEMEALAAAVAETGGEEQCIECDKSPAVENGMCRQCQYQMTGGG